LSSRCSPPCSVQHVGEVGRDRRIGKVIALTLDDVGGELWRRRGGGIGREEANIANEKAADNRVFAWRDQGAPVVHYATEHLIEAGGAIGLAEVLPCLGNLHRDGAAEEAPAGYPVVRVMGLEEERLAWGENAKLPATAGLPEIDLGEMRAGREEPIPCAIGDAHIAMHAFQYPPVAG
jgi:hypothetical protein